jgi:hypothetical protein
MLKKIKYIAVFLLSFYIIAYGFVKVSSELPQFIKDRSPLKVFYSQNPFDLEFDIGDYIVYINNKAVTNIKEGAAQYFIDKFLD